MEQKSIHSCTQTKNPTAESGVLDCSVSVVIFTNLSSGLSMRLNLSLPAKFFEFFFDTHAQLFRTLCSKTVTSLEFVLVANVNYLIVMPVKTEGPCLKRHEYLPSCRVDDIAVLLMIWQIEDTDRNNQQPWTN